MPFHSPQRPFWWPENEAWPPPGSAAHWRRRRGRFMRRMGVTFGLLLVLAVVGVFTIVSHLFAGPGGGVPRPVPHVLPLVLLAIPLVAAVFFILMRRVGGPFGDIVSAANQVGGGNFKVRVAASGPPFLRALGSAFNVMAGRLDAHEQQRRRLMEDVAHELRTPLSIMRGRVEGMLDGVYTTGDGLKDVLDQTLTLERLVDDLATLASAEGGTLRLAKEPTDVGTFVADVASSLRQLADAAGVSLTTDVVAPAPVVDLDPIRIREVVANLVVNALQHTPAGGRVVLRLTSIAGGACLQVVDTGRGIAPEDLDGVFERFRKGPGSRGSGLGLAIARELVRAHGGTIEVTSALGEGTTMTVRI